MEPAVFYRIRIEVIMPGCLLGYGDSIPPCGSTFQVCSLVVERESPKFLAGVQFPADLPILSSCKTSVRSRRGSIPGWGAKASWPDTVIIY